jgi:hypothetical protein
MSEFNQPNPEQVWHLKEGEMTQEEIRTLGHLLYVGMFTRIPEVVRLVLLEDHQHMGKDPNDFDVRVISADRYVDAFASTSGLNGEVLKRWTDNASVELAHTVLPLVLAEYHRLAQETQENASEFPTYPAGIINPIKRVSMHGIRAFVKDHCLLVGEVFYMDRNLDAYRTLKASLVEDIFYQPRSERLP